MLKELLAAIETNQVELVDLSAPLWEGTPTIRLPEHLGQAWPFRSETISRFDENGPTAYWNNIRLSEHTGTHFDAPAHWISGRSLHDISQIPLPRLIRPASVLDFSDSALADPDFLLRRDDVEAWCSENGTLPDGGWLLLRTGWDRYVDDEEAFLNKGHTPGISAECAQWLAQETTVIGVGVETVGTDAGQAAAFTDQPFPCHWYFHGANKYGLTQLQNLACLPAQGAVLVTLPLPIRGGSGSPCRVLAVVDKQMGKSGV